MIEVEHLTKTYGGFTAVDDVSFRVEKGEVVGFLGPNGAGKTTTLRILAGFLGATRGAVRVAGHDVERDPDAARRAIGYMPELAPLHPEMRVREYLGFRAELKQVARSARKAAIGRALEQARVTDMADVVIGHLSKGYRQRVGLADALLGAPPILILDEPTAGLDPNQIREVRALVKGFAGEHTVLLSTHILSEVEGTCGRAIVIARGKLVAQGSIESIRSMQRARGARLVIRGDASKAREIARATKGVRKAEKQALGEGLVTLNVELAEGEGEALEALVEALVHAKMGVREVVPRKASLEEVFSELTIGSSLPEAVETPAGSEAPGEEAKPADEEAP